MVVVEEEEEEEEGEEGEEWGSPGDRGDSQRRFTEGLYLLLVSSLGTCLLTDTLCLAQGRPVLREEEEGGGSAGSAGGRAAGGGSGGAGLGTLGTDRANGSIWQELVSLIKGELWGGVPEMACEGTYGGVSTSVATRDGGAIAGPLASSSADALDDAVLDTVVLILCLTLFVFAAVALLIWTNVVSVPPGTPWAALVQRSLLKDLIGGLIGY